ENPLMASHTNDTANRKPGTLFVDGVFSEAWKCPSYPLEANGKSHLSANPNSPGNPKGRRQTLLLILKPGFMMKDSNRSRNFFNLGQGQNECTSGGNLMSISRLHHLYIGEFDHSRWLTPYEPHPLAFGFGWDATCRSRGFYFRRTNFAGTDLDPDRIYRVDGRDAYHFEGHKWNIFTVGWRFGGNYVFCNVNGQEGDRTYCGGQTLGDGTTLAQLFVTNTDLRMGDNFEYAHFNAPIRLGTFARPQGNTTNLHSPADSTLGGFISYKDVILDQAMFNRLDDFFWEDGFYYHDPDEPAAYTTPEIDLGSRLGKPVSIRSISWTGRWPDYLRAQAAKNAGHTDPVWGQLEDANQWPQWLTANFPGDDPGNWAPFLVDIKTDDTWHYEEDETKLINSGGSLPTDVDGNKLTTEDPIRLKFYFNLAEDQVEPLRESPYLDDITITYIPAQAVKFLYYQMH
ncbi:hypothetical protein ACFL54_08890, partial [Planctomycetota bacterium]